MHCSCVEEFLELQEQLYLMKLLHCVDRDCWSLVLDNRYLGRPWCHLWTVLVCWPPLRLVLPPSCLGFWSMAWLVVNEGIVGIYRQFTHIGSSGTQSGSLLEEEEFNSIETVIRSMSDKFQTLYTGGDMNLDIARQEENGYYEKKLLRK